MTHPLAEGVVEALVGDKPGGVEGKGEGGLVRRVVTLEVVLQHRPKLVPELQCLFRYAHCKILKRLLICSVARNRSLNYSALR